MQIQKKFRYLDVKKFMNRTINPDSEPSSTSRRVAIKKMSFILFGISPLAKIVGKSLLSPFEIKRRGKTIQFIIDNQVVWEINPSKFDNNAILRFTETEKSFILELIHAEYPNSRLRLDFKAEITREFATWTMNIQFPYLGINQKIPFISWLHGYTNLSGELALSKTIFLGKQDVLHIPVSQVNLNHLWELRLNSESPVVLETMKGKEKFGSLIISITPPELVNWINSSKFGNVSWITLENPKGTFSALSDLKYCNNYPINFSSYPFKQTGIVLANTRKEEVSLLWACNHEAANSPFSYTPTKEETNSLSLYRSRFIKEYSGKSEPFAIIADLGDNPQWYGTTGAAFALAGSPSSAFTLFGEDETIRDVKCDAVIIETAIAVSGARSLPVTYNTPAQVTIMPQDPVKKREPLKTGQIQTTGAIETRKNNSSTNNMKDNIMRVPDDIRNKNLTEERAEPQERINWIYVNKEPLKVNMKIDKPILFNIIRPQDFLNLQFEFVKFQLDGHLLKIDNKKDPSFLIVHFPSQHTREEAIKDGDPLHIPVKYKRAGNSRLVFKVPSDYPPITLTLESLLDWRNFDIQVNYRARWFNTTQSISQIKNSLSNVSMIFSSRKAPANLAVTGAPVKLQKRGINSIKTQQVVVSKENKPMSALEIKVALSSSPQGPGVMALTDEQLGFVLATPDIDVSNVDNIKGSMVNMFSMQPPSLFETSIEAPTFAEISPNQFAAFNHSVQLKDEFGEYDEYNEQGFYIADDTTIVPIRTGEPVKGIPDRAFNEAQPKIIKKPAQTKIASGITVALPSRRNYKNIVSPVVLKIPANIVLKQGQLFELWHSRMGIKLASGEVDENALNYLKTIRVLWSKWAGSVISDRPDSENNTIPFNVPNPKHFHELVHLTSNYTGLKDDDTKKKVTPQPVKANQLMLSSLGAWFNYEYRNDVAIDGISLVAWLQRATMGRDQYIKVVERGYLFPFGHKAVKIVISERKVKLVNNVATAIMIYETFILVKQPELYYGKEQGSGFVPFPFQRVEIKDLEKKIYEKKLTGMEVFELYKVSDNSKPDPFKIEVDDASGQKIRMEVPLAFVDGTISSHHSLVDYYSNNGWDYYTSSPAHRPIAYARSLVPGDTTFETRSILFGADKISYKINNVDFYPEIKEASIYIKQMEELTGERKPIRIELIDDDNLSMVFAKVVEGENASLVFGNSEKSGGLINPNMSISGLSKLTGLTGNSIENLNKLMVDLDKIFKLADKFPKLFGIINFIDLLLPDVDLSDSIDKIKDTIEQIRNQIESLQKEMMSVLARIDGELKKLDVLLQIIGDLLDQNDIITILQDIGKLAQAMEAYGVQIPGDMSQALMATISVGKAIKDKDVQLGNIIGYVNNAQALKNKLTEAGVSVSSQLSQSIDQMLPLVHGLNNTGLGDEEIISVIGSLGLANQMLDIQNIIKTIAIQLTDKVLEAIPEIPNVKFQVKGNDVVVEYHWKPKTKNEYNLGSLFGIKNLEQGKNQIDVSVDSIMTKSIDLKNPPVFDAKASVKEFSLTIAESIQLNFKKIEFKAGMSSKPDVDVKFQSVPIRLIGALSFVNSLQSVVKSSQFESGPFIDITSNGIVAGYNFPLPNLAVGIFSISNMMLGVKISLPFSKDPFKFGFNFCTRENPFKLMVSCFGGGGFFMLETTMQGLTRLEAAFEFGAGISLDVGVASGSVEVMGGFYYVLAIEYSDDGDYYTQSFTAYLRLTGRLSIIGLIKVTLEFYLELRYEQLGQKTTPEGLQIAAGSRLVGTATLSVKIEILFFSKTVKVTVKRTLAGNDADPKFEQTYKPDHWLLYCTAFAS